MKKKLFALTTLLLITCLMLCITACSVGNGTEDDGVTPDLTIKTAAELTALAGRVNGGDSCAGAYIALGADIDLKNGEWTPIGNSYTAFFAGTFNGNGYKISNMKITQDGKYLGMFGHNKGTIKNLKIESFNIKLAAFGSTTEPNIGGLIGYNNAGTITNCSASGTVNVNIYLGFTGVLIGTNINSDITNCSSEGLVKGSGYAKNLGGLIGRNTGSGKVEKCYSTARVWGQTTLSDAGGLIGASNTAVTDCYATGQVNACGYAGGLIGNLIKGAITRCYAAGAVSNVFITDNGTSSDSRQNAYAGGLIGYIGSNLSASGKITDCYATGSVTGSSLYINPCAAYAGGLIGGTKENEDAESVTVTNCYATGSVSAEAATSTAYYVPTAVAGGLIGHCGGATVMKCFAAGKGTVIATSGGSIGLGGVFGSAENSALSDNYRYSGQTFSVNSRSSSGFGVTEQSTSAINSAGTACSADELSKAFFYTGTLGWSGSVWNFSGLNFSSGKYPKLR